MADQLFLSYWVRGFTEHNMLRHYEKLLQKFPFSTISPASPLMRIYAIELIEPPVLEYRLDWVAHVGTVIEAAGEFKNPDCAYMLEAYWDLWLFDGNWKLAPSLVTLACFGPLFQNDLGDQLRIECGMDSHFLPQPEVSDSASKVQSNIRGLLRLAHELDDSLPVVQRKLWSESGENFAERLQAALL